MALVTLAVVIISTTLVIIITIIVILGPSAGWLYSKFFPLKFFWKASVFCSSVTEACASFLSPALSKLVWSQPASSKNFNMHNAEKNPHFQTLGTLNRTFLVVSSAFLIQISAPSAAALCTVHQSLPHESTKSKQRLGWAPCSTQEIKRQLIKVIASLFSISTCNP